MESKMARKSIGKYDAHPQSVWSWKQNSSHTLCTFKTWKSCAMEMGDLSMGLLVLVCNFTSFLIHDVWIIHILSLYGINL